MSRPEITLAARPSGGPDVRREGSGEHSNDAKGQNIVETLELEYVEFYTNDLLGMTQHFVSRLGFRECARSNTSHRESVLLRHGAARLIITAGGEAEAFLSSHPEGIGNIGVVCATGLVLPQPTTGERSHNDALQRSVPGLGDVHVTLMVREKAAPAANAPPDRTWTYIDPDGPEPLGPNAIRRIDHLAVCVEAGQLDIAARSLRSALGLQTLSSERIEVGEQAMNSLVVGDNQGRLTFTILEPDVEKQPGQIDNFLRRNRGPGVQHIAFLVSNIVSAVHAYGGRGVDFLRTPAAYYEQLPDRLSSLSLSINELREANVLVDREELGYLFQIFTAEPREESAVFYELIERRGARGFGSANIRRALRGGRTGQYAVAWACSREGVMSVGDRFRQGGLLSVRDHAQSAKSKLPRPVWDFIAGESGVQRTVKENLRALDKVRLRPRVLMAAEKVDMGVELFGRTWPAPMAVGRMALQTMVHPGSRP